MRLAEDEEILHGAWRSGDPIPPPAHDPSTVDQCVAAACQLTAPARAHRPGRVRCNLSSPVFWHGRQWAVTSYGVECLERPYWIPHRQLWDGEEQHGWVRHLANKRWVDLPDFVEALRVARSVSRGRK